MGRRTSGWSGPLKSAAAQPQAVSQSLTTPMINSTEEFIRLRTSNRQEEYSRAAQESAPVEVWEALIEQHPDMRFWVAQNKTVPVVILERLARDADSAVRALVAAKRKLPPHIQVMLATDSDESVRDRLVHNAKAVTEVLAIISAGSDRVAGEAQRRLAARSSDAGEPPQ